LKIVSQVGLVNETVGLMVDVDVQKNWNPLHRNLHDMFFSTPKKHECGLFTIKHLLQINHCMINYDN
jgi:hypothetical protein